MFSLKRFLLSVFLILFPGILIYSQEKGVNRDKYLIHIARTSETIKTDGVLDEKTWQESEVAENFFRVTPVDTGYALAQISVMITYDKSRPF